MEEYEKVKQSNQQQGFENFARQVALAISAVIKNQIELIESQTNVIEPDQNTQLLRQCVGHGLAYLI